MKIYGYSERGMINSFFYEILYSKNPEEQILEFLKLAKRPDGKEQENFVPERKDIKPDGVKVYIEQSLSDFGDADAIITIEAKEKNYIYFIEAKVKAMVISFVFKKELLKLSKTIDIINKKLNKASDQSSNLFIQLYHKKFFWEEIVLQGKNEIMIPYSGKGDDNKERKKGTHVVVKNFIQILQALSKRAKTYSSYLCLVPEFDLSVLLPMYDNLIKQNTIKDKVLLDVLTELQFIFWEDVRNNCGYNTRLNFDYNGKQIL